MTFDLVLQNGTIVTTDSVYEADIGIRGRKIAGIGKYLTAPKMIDVAGKYITPGAIDVHVHLQYNVGGIPTSDDFFTGTRAAALGGTTTILDFVEADPEQALMDALIARNVQAQGQAVVDYGFHMTIKPTDIPKLPQILSVIDAGCPTFKHYMAYDLRLNDGQMLQSFFLIAKAGGLAIVHAENWDVISVLIARNLARRRVEPRWHPRCRPTLFEGQAAKRAIDLAVHSGAPLYIFHVSCDAVIQRMMVAQSQGLPIYGETCPQYLVLDDSVFERPGIQGMLPVCSPPIRDKSEQMKLWGALERGVLQVVSTDHCPFMQAQKAMGNKDFSRIPGGVPSIQSRFMLLYTYGVRRGWLSLSQWVDRCCTAPAKLFGLEDKGQIAEGFDADLVVFDPEAQMVLSTSTLQEQVDWTPYEGMPIHGKPAMTISRGEIIVEKGEFIGRVGRGEFVPRRLQRLAADRKVKPQQGGWGQRSL